MAAYFLRHGIAYIHIQQLFTVTKNVTPLVLKRDFHLSPYLKKRVSFNLSDIGEGIREVTVKEWYVKEGDTVEQFDNLCEVQSDKASVTITSRYDGKIMKLHCKTDDIAFVGKPLLDFDVSDVDDEPNESSDSDTEPKVPVTNLACQFSGSNSEHIARQIRLSTPAVRRIVREHNINLSHIPPTGKNGRVLKGDVMEYLGMVPRGTNVPHPTIVVKPQGQQSNIQTSPNRVEKLKGIRRAMFKSMSESLKIPHFAYCDEIDVTKLVKFRDQLRSTAKEEGAKITFMPFFIKAASIALLKYPILNSSLDLENESVVYRGSHNISVAISIADSGLVVPNIKDCQRKTIVEIARDLNDLIERGRAEKLTPDDFVDGTFSLSNIGVIGGTYTHPCIMAPQVAIGALGRTNILPRFNEYDDVVKAYIMNVSWCADHRIIDGVTMANFSNLWKKYLENPTLFLLH